MNLASAATLGLALSVLAVPALADAACHRELSFPAWLAATRADAVKAGISSRAAAALDGLTPDPRVARNDRGQPTLSQGFLQFADRLITPERLKRGSSLLAGNASTFRRIDKDYGVPGPVLVAFWGLETDYGAYMGDYDSVRSLATLAYDCRRADYFRNELLAALRLLDNGDLQRPEMHGAWAGELGQVQFTPSNYLKYAVDYDGDGRRDLVGSVPDALASAAKFLVSLGWQPGEPWLEEVRVSAGTPWDQSARAIQHPRSFWNEAGIRRANGSPLPADTVPCALILPMGRSGPAFLAYRNFGIFWQWNQSSNYSLAAAYLATRLAGAPEMTRGSPPAMLNAADLTEVQKRLAAAGIDAGDPDGRLGEALRAGVRTAQIRLGMPPDGFPTQEFLDRLRTGR